MIRFLKDGMSSMSLDLYEEILKRNKSHTNRIIQIVPCKTALKEIRAKNLNRIVLAHLNINSLRNKFDIFTNQITGNVDVLIISGTKVDDSFPEGQFKIPGYSSPFRLDRDQNGGVIMAFVRQGITAKFLSFDDKAIEALYIKLNFQKKKWLLSYFV